MDIYTQSKALCPQLKGPENYPIWKARIEMVLVREKLWSIVCKRRTKPESGQKAQADFDEEAERATATIFIFLSTEAIQYVHDLRDPVDVWEKLNEVFGKIGFAARYNLWKKLFNIKAEESQTIIQYLDQVRSTANLLREAGIEIPDEILVTVALQGLGERFDSLVSVITHGERPTFDKLAGILTEESVRVKKTVREEAYIAEQKGCWHCGKLGHRRDRCFELHPELKSKSASTGPLPTPNGRQGLSPPPEQPSLQANW